ncbi:glycerol kinase [Alkalispirochaeta americana]|uniref:Glycerol kinase n=1 Tax=Alkalispirochaeta americana TaxID=159291 RepID=A0A1N6QW63_9SPIO|nr:FGGY family carbohydrate kinase [Alkalispirochaeta americana]SIQ20788.1 glycerol kinase [Alkalispirochaeta americana]
MSKTDRAQHYLAIDQGGQATRAILFDNNGTALAEFSAPITTSHPAPDQVEHDPEEMARSVQEALSGLAEILGDQPPPVQSAGFATQRSSVAFWDRSSGAALAPIASWQDRRDASHLETLPREASQEIPRITGLRISPHYGANKLRWFLKNHEAVKAAAEAGTLCCGPLASFLLARSLHESPAFADPANASRTLLWDVHTKNWSDYLLHLFQIPQDVLPESVPSRHAYGTISLGQQVIPVTVCTGDQSAAVFAAGKLDEEAVYVNIGTGAFIQKPTRARHDDAAPLLQSVVWDDGSEGIRVLEGTINGAAGALVEWIGQEEPNWARYLNGWLEETQDPPLFLNGVSGLAAPYWIPDFPSCYVGHNASEAPLSARATAVAESVIFLLEENRRVLEEKGEPVKRIIITGGLAKSDALCQRLASLTKCEVIRPSYSEATARGLCYLLRSCEEDATEESWQAASGASLHFLPRQAVELHRRYQAWREELLRRLT